MTNLDVYLNRLRWDTVYGKFTEMSSFSTDAIEYKFKHPLTNKEQMAFMDFIKDTKTINSHTPVDFCNFLIQHRIEFAINFKYNSKLSIRQNWSYYKIVKILQGKLEKIRSIKWHRIYDETDLPQTTGGYLIQTNKDFEQNTYQHVIFDADRKMFLSITDMQPIQNVMCWI